MPRNHIITPPWQNQDLSESGKFASELIDGVITDQHSLVSRPGLFKYKQVVSNGATCQGIFWWKAKNLLLVVYGGIIYVATCKDAGIPFTAVNTIAPLTTGHCTFAANRHWVYIVSGGKIVRWDGDVTHAAEYDPTAATIGLTEVTHVAYIDGYIVGNKAGSQSWYYAEPGALDTDALIWSASGLTAEGSPDNIQAMAAAWREIIILGNDSTELWYDSGGADTPFRRLEGAFIEQGTSSPYSLLKVDNTWIWLSQKKEVIRLKGRTPTVISQPIREKLADIRVVSDATSFVLWEYYVLNFPTAGITWAYDLIKSVWYQWGNWIPSLFKYSSYRGEAATWADLFGVYFVGGENGTVFLTEKSLRTDDGSLIRTEYTSKAIDHDTFDYKFCNSLGIKFKRGSDFVTDSFGRFVTEVSKGVEIPQGVEMYFQWENMALLGSKNWAWAWSPLPYALSFNSNTRELTGTAIDLNPVTSILTLTNTVTGFVLQFEIVLTPGATLPDDNQEREVILTFQDEDQNWSQEIPLKAGTMGEHYSVIRIAPMGRYISRRYRFVFSSKLDTSIVDVSERVSLEMGAEPE